MLKNDSTRNPKSKYSKQSGLNPIVPPNPQPENSYNASASKNTTYPMYDTFLAIEILPAGEL